VGLRDTRRRRRKKRERCTEMRDERSVDIGRKREEWVGGKLSKATGN
jgi:hypothetical protein